MEKLRSSFRSLQEAVVTSIKPIGPVCIEKAKTHSFRELDVSSCSFHGFSCSTPTPSTSLSSSALSKLDDPAAPWSTRGLAAGVHLDEITAAQSSSSSSSSSPASSSDEADDLEGIPKSLRRRSSERFFFSSHSTKSIMEEAAEPTVCSTRSGSSSSSSSSSSSKRAAFCDGSLAVAMASDDPYYDFRASMEEMVAAHELRDWRCLQELFHCYLMLNDKSNHSAILLAFVDLLMQLRSQCSDGFSSSSSSSSCSSR